jgi:hypothetical protein
LVKEEIRDYIIGYSWSNRMLLVVYVERGWRTRIISARPATSCEREKIMNNEKEIVTEEGFIMKPYLRETKEVSINMSVDTIELLEKKAKERDLSLKALLKFFISQGLRQELTPQEAGELFRKRMKSRKGIIKELEVDLAA